MKKIYYLMLLLIISGCFNPRKTDNSVTEVKRPSFPDREFNILMYGAIGDGKRDNSDVIRKAIEDCHAAGGGRVVIPEGSFICGPIYLKSNVNLHLKRGSTILFSSDPTIKLSSLLYAFKEKNIAVTGEGTLHGQASPVQPQSCENVLIEGIKLIDSPISVVACKNVWIKDCDFYGAESAISSKSGEDMMIQNCRMMNGSGEIIKIVNKFSNIRKFE